jgi:glutathione S-transferase
MLGDTVAGIKRFGPYLDDLPNLAAYADRLLARPALQKARAL